MLPFSGFPHVLEAQQFEPEHLISMFEMADAIRSAPERFQGIMSGITAAILFAEPSTRTRSSFEFAARRLGAEVFVAEHMKVFSSVAKGESIEDTIRTFLQYRVHDNYCFYFIIRWHEEGGVAKAARVAGPDHPVINAGDGSGQHPTQALLDLYTIYREWHDLNRPLTVMMVGDLKDGRTVHSLTYLLAKFPNVRFVFISPGSSRMKEGIISHLESHHRQYVEYYDQRLSEITAREKPDVLYVTRAQLERRDQAAQAQLREEYKKYVISNQVLEHLPASAIIMHPLPRGPELPEDVDRDVSARYFSQMGNGLWLRMALLERIESIRKSQIGHRQ